MSRDLEQQLREALGPVDPGEEFTARVLARLAAEPPATGGRDPGAVRFRPRRRLWIPLALAASLAAVIVLGIEWRERRDFEGLEARRELIEALRVTSEKLDLAYRLVNRPAPSGTERDSGA